MLQSTHSAERAHQYECVQVSVFSSDRVAQSSEKNHCPHRKEREFDARHDCVTWAEAKASVCDQPDPFRSQ